MSGFAYFDGEKWVENLTMKDIRALAMSGVISESTLIRNPDGQEKEARFCGLFFSNDKSQVADFLKGSGDLHSEEDESIMAPAVAIIETLIGLAVAGIILLCIATCIALVLIFLSYDMGLMGLGVMVLPYSITFLFQCIIFTALLVVLKYFAICFGQIEKNTRKDD